mmetsp:Transcript_6476/g.10595  ORF Transcript_6476/g.10595 Transcript_6476/m.10595 type:complete len:312 (-) Transcript_6476:83-1018(-)
MATKGAEQNVPFKRKFESTSEGEAAASNDTTSTTQQEADVHMQMNKSQHHFLIAAWLVASFGQSLLRSRGGYVVDVAGGLGKLDFELSVRYGVPSVLIDPKFSEECCGQTKHQDMTDSDQVPAVRDRRSTLQLSSMLRRKMKKLSRSRISSSEQPSRLEEDRSPLMKLLRQSGLHVRDDGHVLPRVTESIGDDTLLPFQHVPDFFPLFHTEILNDPKLLKLLSTASFIIGVHPDQVTESIVDIAIHLRIPFAVIPCCVFTKLFPERKTTTGDPVRTYEELVDYLLKKHKNIVKGILPFIGRNIVLYCASFD